MMMAKASGDGRDILILGLSHANIGKIMAGQPLVLSERTNAPKGSMPAPNFEIMIITGETEQQMHEMFKKYGLIGDQTKVTVDPRL
jgi:hypothetical protein